MERQLVTANTDKGAWQEKAVRVQKEFDDMKKAQQKKDSEAAAAKVLADKRQQLQTPVAKQLQLAGGEIDIARALRCGVCSNKWKDR